MAGVRKQVVRLKGDLLVFGTKHQGNIKTIGATQTVVGIGHEEMHPTGILPFLGITMHRIHRYMGTEPYPFPTLDQMLRRSGFCKHLTGWYIVYRPLPRFFLTRGKQPQQANE